MIDPHFDCGVDLCIPVNKKDDMGSDNNSKDVLEETFVAKPATGHNNAKDVLEELLMIVTPPPNPRTLNAIGREKYLLSSPRSPRRTTGNTVFVFPDSLGEDLQDLFHEPSEINMTTMTGKT